VYLLGRDFDGRFCFACHWSEQHLRTASLFDLHYRNLSGRIPGYPTNNQPVAPANQLFGELGLLSIGEVDSSSAQVGNVLHEEDFTWWVTSWLDSQGNLLVQHDAISADIIFLRVLHQFFLRNGEVFLQPGNTSLPIHEGTVKTTIEITLWPFQASSDSLALDLSLSALDAIGQPLVSAANNSMGVTTYEFNQGIKIFFGALGYALYDAPQIITGINISVAPQQPGSTSAGLTQLFPSFNLFASYDPQFSVLLSVEAVVLAAQIPLLSLGSQSD